MEISATTSQTDLGLTSTLAGGSELGRDEFLSLLILQMRNQDPLDPMENQEFIAQLAQFTSLEQMMSLNQKFDDSMVLTQSLNNAAAAGMIGRTVRANGSQVDLADAGGTEVGYFLPVEAAEVTLKLFDDQGVLVRTITSSEGTSGPHHMTWDGKDDLGDRVAAGRYQLQVSAKDETGAAVDALTVVSGKVEGVTFKNGGALLLINGQELPLSSLLEVYEQSE
ncbi:MAG: flagellar hook capping protein [Candidatus Eisenbacteria bacterium]|nr:flagellar hook capping protein [Candidatus Eisenbacteria bacterium]MCC7142736.1 flagellar hook capping protein [Candidatus Eisenbacteria bacterium]